MRILIAEDEKDLLDQYKDMLEDKGYKVTISKNGDECVKIYRMECENNEKSDDLLSPFDAVILDYQMPLKNGLDTAKEILEMNSHQRIIFASGFVQETFFESIKNLKQITEIMKKPFHLQALVDTLEDKEIYQKLEKLNVDIAAIKELNPSHAQIKAYFDVLCQLQKGRTF
ncbi:MAG: response regulator [Thaumarchaeota archaeon]|nr:response regulator [Nitrososphaerota archaeon]MDE1877897.1 response regulator [Nitrososphaerota archaeon]